MVGHTGDLKATMIGCKAADEAVKVLSSSVVAVHATFSNVVQMMYKFSLIQVILDAIEQVGGIFVVTADHGNAEDMVKRDKSGKPIRNKDGNVQPLTSHTLNPVSAYWICFASSNVMSWTHKCGVSHPTETVCRSPSPLEVQGLHLGLDSGKTLRMPGSPMSRQQS
jgi:hypothetical protein